VPMAMVMSVSVRMVCYKNTALFTNG